MASQVQRFRIGKTVYVMPGMDEISLRDIVRFNTEATALGIDERWGDVVRASREMSGMTEQRAEEHDLSALVLAASIWLARRTAGEDISFEDAIDIPQSAIEWLVSPEDHKPGKRKAAKKAATKSTRTSAPADEPTVVEG